MTDASPNIIRATPRHLTDLSRRQLVGHLLQADAQREQAIQLAGLWAARTESAWLAQGVMWTREQHALEELRLERELRRVSEGRRREWRGVAFSLALALAAALIF